MTGILGSGFGLYGYLPAVLRNESKVFLMERSREKFTQRIELAAYSEQIIWEKDISSFLAGIDTLIISVPPFIQEQYQEYLAKYTNIEYLLLEKPVAVTPGASQVILDRLTKNGVNVRIGYSFLYTNWYKESKIHKSFSLQENIQISWKFKAHHFKNNLHNWKRYASQGGGVLRFFGIHLIPIAIGFGFDKVMESAILNYKENEPFQWTAVFRNKSGKELTVIVDANSEETIFLVRNMSGEILIEKESPFDNEPSSNEDKRVHMLDELYHSLHNTNETAIQMHLYSKINQLWSETEKITSQQSVTI